MGGGGQGARWRDAPNASGRLTSFSVKGRESRALPRSSWCVHCWCEQFVLAVDTLTVDSWVALISVPARCRARASQGESRITSHLHHIAKSMSIFNLHIKSYFSTKPFVHNMYFRKKERHRSYCNCSLQTRITWFLDFSILESSSFYLALVFP